jgi:phage terminase Nu1 subunit (DNA packaging protein)
MLVTFSELALLKGVSKGAVTAAVRTGRISAAVVEKDGKRWLDRDEALELWNRNTRPTHNAKISQPDAIEAPPPRDAEGLRQWVQQLPAEAIPALHESRARREHFQAELAAMQVAQGRGELVSAAEVQKEAFHCARNVRDNMLSIPARLAPELAGCTDARTVYLRLEQEITNALRALATRQTGAVDSD